MMVDTTIYGYIVNDFESIHTSCIEDGDTVSARLYSMDDNDPYGLTCDACGGFIFEPEEEHDFRVDTKWSTPNNLVCSDCGHRYDEAPHTPSSEPLD